MPWDLGEVRNKHIRRNGPDLYRKLSMRVDHSESSHRGHPIPAAAEAAIRYPFATADILPRCGTERAEKAIEADSAHAITPNYL